MQIKIDEDFKNLLPDITAEEYTALEKSIVKYGVLSPLILWNGFLVDGHNRYKICQAHHIDNFPVNEMVFNSKADAMQWIVDNQFSRRNLTLSEKVVLQAKVHAELEREAAERVGGRPRKDGEKPVVNLPEVSGRVSEQMAAKIGVSEKTYRDAKYVVEHGTQEQINRMDKKIKVEGKPSGVSAIANEIREKDVPDGMKRCKGCNKILPLSDFYRKSGSTCKSCEYEQKKKRGAIHTFRDIHGRTITTANEYKKISDQGIIDGLLDCELPDATIKDVVDEFMANFRNYMGGLVAMLHSHETLVKKNREEIADMWKMADEEFQKVREEYI